MVCKSTAFIVDDDPAILETVSELVEMIDLQAKTFTSAREFLEAYEPTAPACLILDVRMPGMSGLELQKRLSGDGVTLPIIIITAHGDVRMAVEAVKAALSSSSRNPSACRRCATPSNGQSNSIKPIGSGGSSTRASKNG